MNQFKPFPIGTVRGPYYGNNQVTYMVQGAGGWLPFSMSSKDEVECEKQAREYSEKLLSAP